VAWNGAYHPVHFNHRLSPTPRPPLKTISAGVLPSRFRPASSGFARSALGTTQPLLCRHGRQIHQIELCSLTHQTLCLQHVHLPISMINL